jgi:hypothetical protein
MLRRRKSTPSIVFILWGFIMFIMLSSGAIGYMIADQRKPKLDPDDWRCIQYVPGSADCQWLERR